MPKPAIPRAIRATATILALSVSVLVHAQSERPSSGADRGAEKFVNPETAVLELYVGPWAVVEKHYNPQGSVVATVEGSEEVAWIVDQRAIRRSYTTSSASTVYRAFGVLSWDDVKKVYRGVWVDNASTNGPSAVTGKWQPGTQTMIYTVESQTDDGAPVTYKVVDRFIDPEQRETTTYRMNGTEVVKLIDVQYKRTIPCPGKLRVIFDGIQE